MNPFHSPWLNQFDLPMTADNGTKKSQTKFKAAVAPAKAERFFDWMTNGRCAMLRP
jgi:hypothetical protein